ncbi:MAG: caspase family protein [Methanobacteriaceae archaeon]|nr:caspase family protein [Methanobacteriaceae archaeon]
MIFFIISLILFTGIYILNDQCNEYFKLNKPSEKYAYLVGISNYKDSDQELTLGSSDALKFKSFLEKNAGFNYNNTLLRMDSEAKNSQITQDLKTFTQRSSTNDLFIFYYSGHGDRLKTDESGNNGYEYIICPYDDTEDYKNSLKGSKFQLWIKEIEARNLVFIFDSCNSGGMIESLTSNNPYSRKYVILASCQANESSVGDEKLDGGVFTYFLLEAFTKNEADINKDGWISIEEAFAYARPLTIENCNFFGDLQHPQIFDGDPKHDIKLVKVK